MNFLRRRVLKYLLVAFLSIIERQKKLVVSVSDINLDTRKDEEDWHLRDVIFVEDMRNIPTGRVLKVDGAYAAVRFPASHARDKESSKDLDDIFQDCRLMRKEDLQVSHIKHIPQLKRHSHFVFILFISSNNNVGTKSCFTSPFRLLNQVQHQEYQTVSKELLGESKFRKT